MAGKAISKTTELGKISFAPKTIKETSEFMNMVLVGERKKGKSPISALSDQVAMAIATNTAIALTILPAKGFSSLRTNVASDMVEILINVNKHLALEYGSVRESDADGEAYWHEQAVRASKFRTQLGEGHSILGHVELYLQLCRAQARFVTAREDFHFLTDCICVLVIQEKAGSRHVDELAKLASDVIIQKKSIRKGALKTLDALGMPKVREAMRPGAEKIEVVRTEKSPWMVYLDLEEMEDFQGAMVSILKDYKW